MLGKSLAIIVASPRERSGTTLAARLFAEFFLLAGEKPLLFDTDTRKPKFSRYFPGQAEVADLERTRGQMSVFDRMAMQAYAPKIVDVAAYEFERLVRLMRETDLVPEAKARNVEPVLVYLPHYRAEDYERGLALREEFACPFVLIENAFVGEPGAALNSVNAYWTLKASPLHMRLAKLDGMNMSLLEDERLALGEFLKHSAAKPGAPSRPATPDLPLAYLSLAARSKIRAWLKPAMHEVARAVQMVQARLDTLPTEIEPL